MRDFGRALTATLELPVLLEVLLARVRSTLQVGRAMVFLADERAAEYGVRQSSGDISPQVAQMIHFRERDWLVRRLQAGEIVYLQGEDVKECPAEEQARLRVLRVVLNVPLRTKARLVGWLALGPKESGDLYSRDDLLLLTAMADQTVIAVENAQLYEKQIIQSRDLARRAQQLANILRLGNTLKSLDLEGHVEGVDQHPFPAGPFSGRYSRRISCWSVLLFLRAGAAYRRWFPPAHRRDSREPGMARR